MMTREFLRDHFGGVLPAADARVLADVFYRAQCGEFGDQAGIAKSLRRGSFSDSQIAVLARNLLLAIKGMGQRAGGPAPELAREGR